ncbi:hypothetical protein [Hymenobacter volaticus]|uniref:Secreted protein n=1 Tax=Hymenobacter volaticus TaxID=2932254 RepID=A0ABY4GD17_9BACT|nr:hypothetical protein [Hymenobacter volaticus]UOQ68641.1 hypothetical protein MUN86_23225 [Hymenobacter volaticus]
MFRSLFLFRRLLATTLLVVFVNVFVGQCWCAATTSAASGKALMADCHTKPAKPMPASCKMHGLAKEGAAKGKTDTSRKSSGKHDCCKDKSTSLLSSLITPAEKQVVVPAPALLPTAVEFHFRPMAGSWDRTASVKLVPPRLLKPKIPDIRIFIQSLTV